MRVKFSIVIFREEKIVRLVQFINVASKKTKEDFSWTCAYKVYHLGAQGVSSVYFDTETEVCGNKLLLSNPA